MKENAGIVCERGGSGEGPLDAAYDKLDGLTAPSGHPAFTFLEDQVIYGRELLRELKSWDFGRRLFVAGIQRLE